MKTTSVYEKMVNRIEDIYSGKKKGSLESSYRQRMGKIYNINYEDKHKNKVQEAIERLLQRIESSYTRKDEE